MWEKDDLKQTRAYQEAEQAGEEKVLRAIVPLAFVQGDDDRGNCPTFQSADRNNSKICFSEVEVRNMETSQKF